MTHARQIIRAAIVQALIDADTAAMGRVYDHPSDPRTTLPAISIEDDSEAIAPMSVHARAGRRLTRSYRLIVSAEVAGNSAAADARDSLLAQIEAAMAAAEIPGVSDIVPLSYQPSSSDTGERPIRVGHQLYEIVYTTTQGNPSAPS